VPPVAQIERRPLQAHGRQAVIEEYMDRRRRTRGPGTGTPVSARAETAGHRGKNGKDERSFAFAQAFGRATDSAQPCRLSERQRTGANGCTKSTSWGSLVRAQYRPSKVPAQPHMLLPGVTTRIASWQGRTLPQTFARLGRAGELRGGDSAPWAERLERRRPGARDLS
jgi:hypothetical protein